MRSAEKMIKAFMQEHREDYLADLKKLISIESIKGKEASGMPYGEGPAEALRSALEIASRYGLYTENRGGRYGIVQFYPGQDRAIDILAHLDIVPAEDDWTVTDPFVMKVVEDRVYGRGAIDDKGPALATIYALAGIKMKGIVLRDNVRLILGCDEESGASELEYYYRTCTPAAATFTPDGFFPVINTEKGVFYGTMDATFEEGDECPLVVSIDSGKMSNMIPGTAEAVLKISDEKSFFQIKSMVDRKGRNAELRLENEKMIHIVVSGKSGHASMPENGDNALTALLEILSELPLSSCEGHRMIRALSLLFPHGDHLGEAAGIKMGDRVSGDLSISLNILHYDLRSISGAFDSRVPICANEENTGAIGQKLKAEGFNFNSSFSKAHHVPENSGFIRELLKTYEKYTGKAGKTIAIGGCTYVHNIANGVVFGCGEENLDNGVHGPDEFAELSMMMTSAEMFAAVIMSVCGSSVEHFDA